MSASKAVLFLPAFIAPGEQAPCLIMAALAPRKQAPASQLLKSNKRASRAAAQINNGQGNIALLALHRSAPRMGGQVSKDSTARRHMQAMSISSGGINIQSRKREWRETGGQRAISGPGAKPAAKRSRLDFSYSANLRKPTSAAKCRTWKVLCRACNQEHPLQSWAKWQLKIALARTARARNEISMNDGAVSYITA